MKRIVFIAVCLSAIIICIITCFLSKNKHDIYSNVILHPYLSDSLEINLSDQKDNIYSIDNISIKPDVNVRYILDKKNKNITLIPVDQFEELTRYELTINGAQGKNKYIFLTGPDVYLSLATLKTTPKTWLENDNMKFCSDSIPLIKYIDKYVINPTTVCQFALSCYEDYIKNNNHVSKLYFMRQVKYLSENYTDFGDGIGFYYSFSSQGLKAPWFSALSQGHAASVFVRAYFLTGDEKYLKFAKKSINYMITKYPNGTLNCMPDGMVWLEEYPRIPPSSVLNGFVFAIFGLIDYSKLFPEDIEIKSITNKCLSSLKKGIPFYDTGHWLIYDKIRKNKVNYHYMGMQTLQMKQLYKATKDKAFLYYYFKWERYFKWENWYKMK